MTNVYKNERDRKAGKQTISFIEEDQLEDFIEFLKWKKSTNKYGRNWIWLGTFPGVFGYGICVVGWTKNEVQRILRETYYESWKGRNGSYPTRKQYQEACEYWGMNIEKIEFNKAYFDDFGY
jgi:hypothetical protein